MKTHSRAETFKSRVLQFAFRSAFRQIRGLLIALAFGECLGFALRADDTNVDLAVQISGTPVFYQQLLWVGPTPPEATESIVLLTVLTNMTAHGVRLPICPPWKISRQVIPTPLGCRRSKRIWRGITVIAGFTAGRSNSGKAPGRRRAPPPMVPPSGSPTSRSQTGPNFWPVWAGWTT